jgi:hypothetical protein
MTDVILKIQQTKTQWYLEAKLIKHKIEPQKQLRSARAVVLTNNSETDNRMHRS